MRKDPLDMETLKGILDRSTRLGDIGSRQDLWLVYEPIKDLLGTVLSLNKWSLRIKPYVITIEKVTKLRTTFRFVDSGVTVRGYRSNLDYYVIAREDLKAYKEIINKYDSIYYLETLCIELAKRLPTCDFAMIRDLDEKSLSKMFDIFTIKGEED